MRGGEYIPVVRGLFTAALVAGVLLILRPRVCFRDDGAPKAVGETWVPWPALVGVAYVYGAYFV